MRTDLNHLISAFTDIVREIRRQTSPIVAVALGVLGILIVVLSARRSDRPTPKAEVIDPKKPSEPVKLFNNIHTTSIPSESSGDQSSSVNSGQSSLKAKHAGVIQKLEKRYASKNSSIPLNHQVEIIESEKPREAVNTSEECKPLTYVECLKSRPTPPKKRLPTKKIKSTSTK